MHVPSFVMNEIWHAKPTFSSLQHRQQDSTKFAELEVNRQDSCYNSVSWFVLVLSLITIFSSFLGAVTSPKPPRPHTSLFPSLRCIHTSSEFLHQTFNVDWADTQIAKITQNTGKTQSHPTDQSVACGAFRCCFSRLLCDDNVSKQRVQTGAIRTPPIMGILHSPHRVGWMDVLGPNLNKSKPLENTESLF